MASQSKCWTQGVKSKSKVWPHLCSMHAVSRNTCIGYNKSSCWWGAVLHRTHLLGTTFMFPVYRLEFP